jgi:REP element-mobilizing transposase RayT
MQLSGIGLLANRIWVEISNHFPFVESDNFVIMPNHVHGIIAINKTGDGNYDCDDQYCRNAINRVSTIPTIPTIPMETIGSKIQRGGITGNKNPMLYKNLATIIRWYKGRVSFESHKIQPYFKWQSNYHDHIIRNEVEYIRIKKYIINNPLNWKEDKFFHL